MEVAALGVRVDGVGNIEQVNEALDEFGKKSEKAEQKAGGLERRSSLLARTAKALMTPWQALGGRIFPQVTKEANSADKALGGLNNRADLLAATAVRAGGLLLTAFSARTVAGYADEWSDMQSVIGAATGEMSEAAGLLDRLAQIANDSYSPIQQTVDTYTRNVGVLRDLGKTAQEAADFTESLNHMLVLTATRGERAASVQNALSKAMAVGKLQADGLETVLANGGEVAAALARTLGTNVSGLRQFASEGKITGQVIANALITSLDDVAERADGMTATLSDAFVRVRNDALQFWGKLDQALGTSAALASTIINASESLKNFGISLIPAIQNIIQYADLAVIALAAFYSPVLLAGVARLTLALGVGLVGAIRAVTAAMLANPIGLIVAAITTATYAVWKFREDLSQWLGVDIGEYAKSGANTIINAFRATGEDLKFIWNNFSLIAKSAFIEVQNAAITAANAVANAWRNSINWIKGIANQIPFINLEVDTSGVDALQLIPNDAKTELEKLAEAHKKAIADINARDNFAGWGQGIKDTDTELKKLAATATNLTLPTLDGGKKGKAAKSEFDTNYIAQMTERIALLGKETEYEQLLARLRVGSIKFATDAERERALALAQTLDGMVAEEEQANKLATLMDRLYPEESRERKKAEEIALITQAFEAGQMSIERYAEAMERIQNPDQIEFWTQWLEAMKLATEDFNELATSVLDNFTTGFGDALSNVLMQGASLKETFANLAHSMVSSIVSALGQMAAQWVVYQLVQKATTKTTQASAASTLAANAAATQQQAALAAYAATAAIPIVGPGLAPAAAGLAMAATAPMVAGVTGAALSGMAHSGIDSIPQTGTWLLERGERVSTAQTSARIDVLLDSIYAGISNIRSSSNYSDSRSDNSSSSFINAINQMTAASSSFAANNSLIVNNLNEVMNAQQLAMTHSSQVTNESVTTNMLNKIIEGTGAFINSISTGLNQFIGVDENGIINAPALALEGAGGDVSSAVNNFNTARAMAADNMSMPGMSDVRERTRADDSVKQPDSNLTVNIHNAPAGTTATKSKDEQGREFIDVWIADFTQDGDTATAVRNKFGLSDRGY